MVFIGLLGRGCVVHESCWVDENYYISQKKELLQYGCLLETADFIRTLGLSKDLPVLSLSGPLSGRTHTESEVMHPKG